MLVTQPHHNKIIAFCVCVCFFFFHYCLIDCFRHHSYCGRCDPKTKAEERVVSAGAYEL